MIAERVANPEQVGLSSQRLQRIDAVLDRFIERGIVAGGVTLVARKGRVAHLSARGQMDLERARPTRGDTIFRLASMTKPVISTAILMLLEEGKLLLNEPVSHFVPAFRNLQVAVPNQSLPIWAVSDLTPGNFHLVPAAREITLRDLLTHTSGFGSATVGPCLDGQTQIMQSLKPTDTLAEVVPRMAKVPLSFQPGTVWEYSGVFGFDTLGHIVELVSGMSLDRFFAERIFGPLGMRETSFCVPSDQLDRVAVPYARTADGLKPGTPMSVLGLNTQPDNRYFSGGGGLAGTAEDYARFALMLCQGGQLDGQRLLGRKTVDLMASNHIGPLPIDRPIAGDMRGLRFGLGVRVVDDPAEATTLQSRGSFGWAGAYGTNSTIDPAEQMVTLMMIQRISDPAAPDLELRSLWPRVVNAAYQALED